MEQKRISNRYSPIRIAHIVGKLWAGGVETVVFNYYRKIDKNDIQFDFYYDSDSTVEPPEDLIAMGARFFKIPPYQDLFRYLKTLKKYFRQNHYKIVHSHINTLSVFPLYAAWSEGVPVRIAHNHSVPGGNELKRNVLKYFLRNFARIFATDYFACSEKAARWLFGEKTFLQGKVVIIRNAVDFSKFKISAEDINYYSEKYALQEKFVVGHVGRFTYAKNHTYLLDIFAAVKKYKRNAVLLLVGDGELHEQIVEKINDLGLQNNVVLTGKVSNPERYYGLMDVLVLPSLFEGLPLTVVEAQASGVPIVISNCVPKEAIISNAYRYVDLKEGLDKWVHSIIEVSKINSTLSEDSSSFDIRNTAPELLLWYKNAIKHTEMNNSKGVYKLHATDFRDNGSL